MTGGGWFDPPRRPTPEEQAAFEGRIRDLYERRQRGLILARSKGPVRYIAGQVRRLGPWIVTVLLLVGLVASGISATVRSALAAAIGIPWPLALALIALVVGLVLTLALAMALWLFIKARFFPHLPAATSDRASTSFED